ncbi:hypothetical protein SAMN04488101_103233 [Pedobacter nyackensis]|uniref:Uncharacterized protein n=1 Tax=Pedobacter nyackensis TaxID=475255 RepID=A0A1W2CA98_9SPHI|nr:hypothetical protein SAMN04488101_103233 [Pedobacter nyackensis]
MLAAVILLLLVATYAYLELRKYKSYRNRVHADADFIVKIDADKLYRTLAIDYLRNSSHYKRKKGGAIKSGLNIPANIFIYTVHSKSLQTYFCSLPVADTATLKSFIKKELGISQFKNTGKYLRGTSANGQTTVAFNNHTFAAGYSLTKENTNDVLEDLLNAQNLLEDKDPKLKQLKAINAHLAYVFKEHTGTGDFKDGLMHLQGDFNFKGFNVDGKVFNHRVFDKHAIVKMWLNTSINSNDKYAAFQVKDHTIYPDSLLKYCKGYIDLELTSPAIQTDTLITYEYNDDFEKEEIITPRTVKVPGINSIINADAGSLLTYLNKEDIVSSGIVNRQLFPLYSVYAKTSISAVMLSTNKHAAFSSSRQNSPYFFYLEADFEKLKAQGQFLLLESYIKQVTNLKVKAWNRIPGQSHFEMDLYFKLKHINALGQLF